MVSARSQGIVLKTSSPPFVENQGFTRQRRTGLTETGQFKRGGHGRGAEQAGQGFGLALPDLLTRCPYFFWGAAALLAAGAGADAATFAAIGAEAAAAGT